MSRRRLPLALAAAVLATACTAGATPAGPTADSGTTGRPSGTTSTVASPSSVPAPTTSTPPPDACARAVLAGLDLAGRAGQVLMIGLPVDDPVPSFATLAPYRIGNVFLAGRSDASAMALRTTIDQLQTQAMDTLGSRLQVAVDQEGGFVQTLSGPGFSVIPTGVQQGGEPDLAGLTGQWAAELAGAGITLDLAPVADVVPAGTAQSNPPIGASSRQFGSDPEAVAEDVSTVVTAMREAGLGTTAKHFPGLGRVRVNTDTSTGATDDQTTAADPALRPFVAAIEAGADAVMVSSASYPQLDPNELAAFSAPIITDLLKGRLGFTGVVVSDDLGDAAAVASRPVGVRAVDFLAAGGDLVLTVNVADAGPMSAALVRRAQNDTAFADRLEEATLRVLRSKQDAGLLTC